MHLRPVKRNRIWASRDPNASGSSCLDQLSTRFNLTFGKWRRKENTKAESDNDEEDDEQPPDMHSRIRHIHIRLCRLCGYVHGAGICCTTNTNPRCRTATLIAS